MSITNHAALGAVIALSVKNPVLVLPLALISHFVLDALPHFGYPGGGFGQAFQHKLTYFYGLLDVVGIIVLAFLLSGAGWLAYAAGIVAMLPDLLHIRQYFFFERKGLSKPGEGNAFIRFHHQIEWYERPWGIFIEILVATAFIILFLNLK